MKKLTFGDHIAHSINLAFPDKSSELKRITLSLPKKTMIVVFSRR